MTRAVLFDLGNTLAAYYELRDFPAILKQSIAGAQEGIAVRAVSLGCDNLWDRVAAENYESPDHCVRPLEHRLRRIFAIEETDWTSDLALAACRGFMQPIFSLAKVYPDTLPTLHRLRQRGIQTAIVSNTPWGSPALLWREEIARLGLADVVDCAVFCGDCGWRKPATSIFQHTLATIGVAPEECIFIGDDPRWDIAGPEAAGIRAVLIDRSRFTDGALYTLSDLPSLLP